MRAWLESGSSGHLAIVYAIRGHFEMNSWRGSAQLITAAPAVRLTLRLQGHYKFVAVVWVVFGSLALLLHHYGVDVL